MALIAKGNERSCDVDVIDWYAHGMLFRGPMSRKTTGTSKIVLHHTGAENPPETVYDNLIERGLSVHFCVSADGRVYQYCDADMLCSHAGRLEDGVRSGNIDTIGIEIVNSACDDPRAGRPMVAEKIHGKQFVRTGFREAQIFSVLALCRALGAVYNIPMRVPERDGAVLSTAMSGFAWDSFRGVVGHLHARRSKSDPGLCILERVMAMGAA